MTRNLNPLTLISIVCIPHIKDASLAYWPCSKISEVAAPFSREDESDLAKTRLHSMINYNIHNIHLAKFFFQNIIRDELKFIKTKRKYAAYSCCFDLYVSFSFHDLISSIRMLYLYSIHCFFLICRSTFLHIDYTVLQATQLKYNK